MLKPIVKLIVALNSNSRPAEIGFGIAAGVLLALVPGGNITWYILLLLFMLFKLNIPSMLLTVAVGKLFAPLTDQLLHSIGSAILMYPKFQDTFTAMYNMPLMPYTNFNSTTQMGALVSGIVLLIPVTIAASLLVILYRRTILPKIRNSKIVKQIKKIPIVSKLINAFSETSSLYSGN